MYDNYDPKTSIGFYSHVSTHPHATAISGKQIRSYHPNAPIFLAFDGNYDGTYLEVAETLGAEYMVSNATMGYPEQPFGYRREKVLEWFKRLYIGFVKLETSHVMMWEEDSVFLGPVEVDELWQCAGHNITVGNEIPEEVLLMIEDFSGIYPNTQRYNCGGCTIFKREPLLKHYHEIYKWLDGNLDFIQDHLWPTIGWMDCLMCIVYMLCGCYIETNPQLYNLDPHNPIQRSISQWPKEAIAIKFQDTNYKIIHNVKGYY